jgi:hypothetical protein
LKGLIRREPKTRNIKEKHKRKEKKITKTKNKHKKKKKKINRYITEKVHQD